MAQAARNRTTNWLKEHAGLWTFGILVVAILGLLGGIGAWGLQSQDRKLTAALTAETKRLDVKIDSNKQILDTRIDSNKEILQRIDKNIEELRKRIDQILERLPAK